MPSGVQVSMQCRSPQAVEASDWIGNPNSAGTTIKELVLDEVETLSCSFDVDSINQAISH